MSEHFSWNVSQNRINHRNDAYHRQCNALRAHATYASKTKDHDLTMFILKLRNAMITGQSTSPAQLVYGSSSKLSDEIISNPDFYHNVTREDISRATKQFLRTKNRIRYQHRSVYFPKDLQTCEKVWNPGNIWYQNNFNWSPQAHILTPSFNYPFSSSHILMDPINKESRYN